MCGTPSDYRLKLKWLYHNKAWTVIHFVTSVCRPCVRCVWTGWRTWSSCVATAPASCVGTEWASAPSAARPSSAASSSTRPTPHTPQNTHTDTFYLSLLLKPTPTTPAKPQSHQLLLLLLDHPHSTWVSQPRAFLNVLLDTTNALLMVWLCSGGIPVRKQEQNMNWLLSVLFRHHMC